MNIYISNINTALKNQDLKNLFSPHGEVQSAEISMDAFTDKSRGFGYVQMQNEEEAKAAITALHQKEVSGAILTVHEAEQAEARKGSYKIGSGVVNTYRFRKN